MKNMVKKTLAYILSCLTLLAVLPAISYSISTASDYTLVYNEYGLRSAIGVGGEIRIESDITFNEPINVTKNVSINFGEHYISFSNDSGACAFIVSGATLTINGKRDGSGITYEGKGSMFKLAAHSSLKTAVVINGGIYYASGMYNTETGEMVYARSIFDATSESGKIVPEAQINGGKFACFDGSIYDNNYTQGGPIININCLTISGGTFYRDPHQYIKSGSVCFKTVYGDAWNVLTESYEMSNEFKNHLNSDGQLELKRFKPVTKDDEEKLAYDLNSEQGNFTCYSGSYNSAESAIYISMEDSFTGKTLETHKVKIMFIYDHGIKEKIDKYISKLPIGPVENLGIYSYNIEDLDLVEWWRIEAPSTSPTAAEKLLKYSDEFMKNIDYNDIVTFKEELSDQSFLYWSEYTGNAEFKIDDVLYADNMVGVRINNVIYVPDDTPNDSQSLINAVQKRMNDYFGEGVIPKAIVESENVYDDTIGTIILMIDEIIKIFQTAVQESPDDEVKQYYSDLIDYYNSIRQMYIDEYENENGSLHYIKEAAGNYGFGFVMDSGIYNFVINKDSSKLESPQCNLGDFNDGVTLFAGNNMKRFKVELAVDKVQSGEERDKFTNLLKSDNFEAYNINVIDKQTNEPDNDLYGSGFELSFKIPEKFDGEEIYLYNINQNGRLVSRGTMIKDDAAVIHANEFGVYVLTNVKIDSAIHPGDINDDGKVTIIDALSVFGTISGKHKAPDAGSEAFDTADCNGDNAINIMDALSIFKHISGRYRLS